MKQTLKRFKLGLMIVLLISMIILPAAAVQAQDDHPHIVALGDSIAFGMSAPQGQGYNDLLANYFGIPAGDHCYLNLSQPGLNSTTILPVITGNKADIQCADIITVNIGANNLLFPVIIAVAGLYNIKPTGDPYDPYNPGTIPFFAALGAAINADPNPQATFGKLLDPKTAESKALLKNLSLGVAQFYKDFPKIVAKLKAYAPKADIYINTIYNPIRVGQSDPFYAVKILMDFYIKPLNTLISRGAATRAYDVVPVGQVFASTPAPVLSFDIATAIVAAKMGDPNYFIYLDPHPTVLGHQLIFGLLADVMDLPIT